MKDEKEVQNTADQEYKDKLKALELRKAEAELQDLEERLAERELKRENKRQRSFTNGATLKQLAANDKSHQERCNHKKGGNGAEGIIGGQGDDPQYAVIKHRMPNGDVWIRCLRCAKTWKPPVESEFTDKDSKFNQAGYDVAQREYLDALAFQTRNQTSGSIVFQFSDGGKHFREVTKNTNLR